MARLSDKPWDRPDWVEPNEPSIVERIGGLADPEIAERIRVYDAWVAAGRPGRLRPRRSKGPGLIATKVVRVEPMPQPVGAIAFFRPRYGSNPKGSSV